MITKTLLVLLFKLVPSFNWLLNRLGAYSEISAEDWALAQTGRLIEPWALILGKCCPHIETSQFICSTGFHMRATLALNGLTVIYGTATAVIVVLKLHKHIFSINFLTFQACLKVH